MTTAVLLALVLPSASAFEGLRAESTWKFYDAGALSGSPAWFSTAYDDSAWASGQAPLGFGVTTNTTINNHGGYTYYFRTWFDVADASSVTGALADLQIDDGAVMYLNGVEAGRWNMPATAITSMTPASTATPSALSYAAQSLNPALLVDGANLLAVEVHQRSTTSSDIYLDAALSLSPHVTAGPWIVQSTDTEVTIAWESYTADAGIVHWGPTSAYGNTDTDAVTDTLHFVTLTGLTADSVYHYAVEADGLTSADFAFRTLPDAGTTDLTVAFYGDSRTHPDVHGEITAWIEAADPDLVLHTGDFVDSPTNPADWYNQVFDPMVIYTPSTPFFAVPGNHETDYAYPTSPYWDFFPSDTGANWWATTVGPVRFIFLDSNDPTYADGDPTDSTQWAWLNAELAAAVEPFVVVSQHHPAYSSGWHATDTSVQGFETYLAPLLESYGVTAFLAGHDHRYERSYNAGTHYLTVGGGGADFQGACNDPIPPDTCVNPYSQFAVTSYCWGLLTLVGDDLWFDVYDENGVSLEPSVLLGSATSAGTPPTVSLTAPDGACDTVDTSVTVAGTAADPDSAATLTIGADTDGAGCDGTTLVSGLYESDGAFSTSAPTTALAGGTWYVYVAASDGVNVVCSYAPGPVLVSHPATAGTVLLPLGSTWSYSATGALPSTNWYRPAYNASAWPTGCGELGYGDGDEQTSISSSVTTAYFRKSFSWSGAVPSSLVVEGAIDDGAIIYLNGREVRRVRMPAGAVSYATWASANGEGSPLTVTTLNASAPGYLVSGTNTLAVEVHQRNATSSDLSFDLRLVSVP